jgi:PKD repeat protein
MAQTLRHGTGYYVGPSGAGPEVQALVAERYEIGMTGLANRVDAAAIKALNPDFQWLVYNSITDNYVESATDDEDEVVAEIAARHGWDHEEAYLHYYDDTIVRMQGQDVFVPGWGGGSAATKAEARVPVYYSNLTRRAVNFSTPQAQQLNKEVLLATTVDEAFDGTGLLPDGIMLDNCAARLFNTGTLISGGHVLETPGRYAIGSTEFQCWHWNYNLGPFLSALKDTLETSPSWSPDGGRKWLGINIANVWSDGYASMDVADILIMEWRYDPVRDTGCEEIRLSRQRDRVAAEAGIRSWYAPLMQQDVPGQPGEITYGEALLGSLAWNLTTRSDETLLFLFGGAGNPAEAGWDTLTWRGCVEVAQAELGSAVGEPYAYAEGTDPTGKTYRVWARHYENGLTLVRNRGNYNQGIEPETATSVALHAAFQPVAPEGEIGAAVSSITLRNGEGAILLGESGPVPETLPGTYYTGSPACGMAPLTVTFTDYTTNDPTAWSWTFGDGGTSTARNPVHTYTSPGTYTVALTAANAQGTKTQTNYFYITVDPDPVQPEAGFIASVCEEAALLPICFTDLSTNGPTAWSWNFGDGGTSTIRNPVHTYVMPGTYTITLTAANDAGEDSEVRVGYITVTDPIGGGQAVEEETAPVPPFQLAAHDPNPVSLARGGISYSIPRAGNVRLEMFAVDGRRVGLLADGMRNAGEQIAAWNPVRQSSGTYLFRLTWEGKTVTRRLLLIK